MKVKSILIDFSWVSLLKILHNSIDRTEEREKHFLYHIWESKLFSGEALSAIFIHVRHTYWSDYGILR